MGDSKMGNFDQYSIERYNQDEEKDYLKPAIESEGGIELLDNEAGWIIGARGGRPLRFPTDKHMITIANTGGGKGTSVAIPNLLNHEGSVLSVEIGGATYHQTAKYRKHILKQDVHVIDPFGITGEQSASFNFIDALDSNKPNFKTEVSKISNTLLKDLENDRNPYFKIAAQSLIEAMIIHVKISPMIDDEERNFTKIINLISDYPNEDWSLLMEEWSDDIGLFRTGLNQVGREFLGRENDTKYSVVSTARAALSSFTDPAISKITEHSTFDVSDLRNKKSSIYVVMPEAEYFSAHASWLRLFVERSFAACPNLGEKVRDFKQNDRVLFMLDEFTQLGKLDAVDVGMQTARQKGITIWAMFQDLGRLKEVYGENIASSFLGAGIFQAFDIGDDITAKYISEKAGKRIVHIPSFRFDQSEGTTETHTIGTGHTTGLQFTDTEGTQSSATENWSVGHSSAETNQTSRGSNTNTSQNESFESPSRNLLGIHRIRYRDNPNMFDQYRAKKRNYAQGSQYGTNESAMEGTTNTQSGQKGGSIAASVQNSRATTNIDTTTQQSSKSKAHSTNQTQGISWTPQILPELDPSQVQQVLGSNNAQIIFVRASNKTMKLIDRKAYFYEMPEIKRRAEGRYLIDQPVYEGYKPQVRYLPTHANLLALQIPQIQYPNVKIDPNVNYSCELKQPLTLDADEGTVSLKAYTDNLVKFQNALCNKSSSSEILEHQTRLYETFAQTAHIIDMEAAEIKDIVANTMHFTNKIDHRFFLHLFQVRTSFERLNKVQNYLDNFEISLNEQVELLHDYQKDVLKKMDIQQEFIAAAKHYQEFLKEFTIMALDWKGIPLPERIQHNTSEKALNYPSREERREILHKKVYRPHVPRDQAPKFDLNFDTEESRGANQHNISMDKRFQDLLMENTIKLRNGRKVSAWHLISILHKRNKAPAKTRKTKIGREFVGRLSNRNLTYYLEKRMKEILPQVSRYHKNAVSEQNKMSDHVKSRKQLWANTAHKINDAKVELYEFSNQLLKRKSDLANYVEYLKGEFQEVQKMDLFVHADSVDVHNKIARMKEWDQLERIKLENPNKYSLE